MGYTMYTHNFLRFYGVGDYIILQDFHSGFQLCHQLKNVNDFLYVRLITYVNVIFIILCLVYVHFLDREMVRLG